MTLQKFLFSLTFLAFSLSISFSTLAQDNGPSEQVLKGEELFKANCAACHKMQGPLVGPELFNMRQKWVDAGEYESLSGEEWLYKWIKNAVGTAEEGYPYAVEVSNFSPAPMTPFPMLSDDDIAAIIAYTDFGEIKKVTDEPVASGDEVAADSKQTQLYLIALVVLLLIIVIILSVVTKRLSNLALEREGLPIPPSVPLWKNKKLRVIIGLAIAIFIFNWLAVNAIDGGRQEGYAPDQPIKYSHALHAGVNGIECQYCHNSAAKGKNSNIPSVNTCMNCHKGITGDYAKFAKYGRKEISKIYASIGFNPNTMQYLEDYQNMDTDSVKAIFRAWLEGDEKKQTESDIKEVLAQVQKPIEWVRIHNLPDHVYFNHSQHVAVAGLQCQECHGPVQEMEVVRQFSTLSMGWCINCHRTKAVNFAGNDYYQIYDKYHEELKKGSIYKVTVEMIGGTQCSKCHY